MQMMFFYLDYFTCVAEPKKSNPNENGKYLKSNEQEMEKNPKNDIYDLLKKNTENMKKRTK